MSIGPWAENIKKRRRHNKIFVSFGSLSRIFKPLHAVLTRYDLRDYDVAIEFAGTFTKGDIPELIEESTRRDRYTRLTDESGQVHHDRYLPNPPILLTGEVESRSGGGGNGNQPALCKQKLVIDPGLPREIMGWADELLGAYREFQNSSASMVAFKGIGGGTLPALELLIEAVKARIRIVHMTEAIVVPCLAEDIAVKNAKAWLSEMLLRLKEPVEEKVIHS